MQMIADHAAVAASLIRAADLQVVALVAGAWLAVRWLLLGIGSDLARLRARRRARAVRTRDEHAEAFDRGLQRLLAEIDARAEPQLVAWRRAA